MPRYRFQWENIPSALIARISAHLELQGELLDAIKSKYGARPKTEFVQDTWNILITEWLDQDTESLRIIAASLRGLGLGDLGIEQDAQYVMSCRNTIRLREIVLKRFIVLGESGYRDKSSTKSSADNTSAERVGDAQAQKLVDDSTVEDIFKQPQPIHSAPIYKGGGSYNPEEYGIGFSEIIDLPAGKYFIGDPSFAIPEEYKSDLEKLPRNLLDQLDPAFGEFFGKPVLRSFQDFDGLGRVAVIRVNRCGVHEDEEGYSHTVESGYLGIVPIDNLTIEQWIHLKSLGRIVDIDSSAKPNMPYVDEEGYDTFESNFQVQIDDSGNVFLGWNWIFCGDDSHLGTSTDEDDSDDDDDEEPSRWQLAHKVKVWYERRVKGLNGSEYGAQSASFVKLYLNQFTQDHPRLHELTAWLDDYCERSYTDLRLNDGPAYESYQALHELISDKYKYLAGSEEYSFLCKAAAECAVGCCIEVNDAICENSRAAGKGDLANIFAEFRDGWDRFYDLAFKE